MNHIITLLTDFGEKDSYVAQMKGVILGIQPQCTLVDISHAIPPQAILIAARILREIIDCYPVGTVHVAVVDPGVGTSRSVLAVEVERQYFVLPDNGLLTKLLSDFSLTRAFVLTESSYWRQPVSSTFHGRDIMAPVAAHLSSGVPLEHFGTPTSELVMLEDQSPTETGSRAVTYVDHFGNLILGPLPQGWSSISNVTVRFKTRQVVARQVATYAEGQPGEFVLLVSSQGELELAVVNGSAARELGISAGDPMVLDLD